MDRTRGPAQDLRDVVAFAVVAAWGCAASVCLLVPGYGWLAPVLAGLIGAGAVVGALTWRARRRHRSDAPAGPG